MHPYYIVYLIMIAVGMVGVLLITRRSGSGRHPIVPKSLFFIIIVGISLTFLIYDVFYILAAIILAGGMIEMISLILMRKRQWQNFLWIPVFGLIAYGFLMCSLKIPDEQLALLLLVIFCFDAFSQVTGQLFGKKKLLPRISPGKTLEGLLGGVIITLVVISAISPWLEIPYLKILVLSILLMVAGFVGDLLASALKRSNGIKDFSNWIPKQGGFLDRFDSLIFAGSCFYIGDLIFST